MDKIEHFASLYFDLKQVLINRGYADEIDWQATVDLEDLTEKGLIKEAAWVIVCSGFSVNSTTRIFPGLTSAFFEWESTRKISSQQKRCKQNALKVFRNERKIEAIISLANFINTNGFATIKLNLQRDFLSYASQFPYIGPVTIYHLAKNVGVNIAKPDRHLNKIAKSVGYSSPDLLCQDISKVTGDKASVVDLVLWRYATLDRNYITLFTI
jgi:hypothetical protein